MSTRVPSLLALMLSALVLTGCGVGMGSAQSFSLDEPIRVGVIPVADFAPVYIADEEGFFEDEGLEVETQVMQNAAAIAPSVINGQLQFGTTAVPPFLTAVERGLPLQAVANGTSAPEEREDDPSALVTAEDSGIERPSDLEGTTVAVNALTSLPHVLATAAIDADGGDPSQVTFVAMPFPDMASALDRGAVDAAAVVEPFYSETVSGGAEVITNLYSDALEPEDSFTLVFTAGPFAERNPEIVEKFQRAVDRASLVAANEPHKVGEVLEEHGRLSPERFAQIRLPGYSDELNQPSLERMADDMQRLGFASESIDVEGAVWK